MNVVTNHLCIISLGIIIIQIFHFPNLKTKNGKKNRKMSLNLIVNVWNRILTTDCVLRVIVCKGLVLRESSVVDCLH